MKEMFRFIILSLIIVSFLSVFVFAETADPTVKQIQTFGDTVYEVFRPFLERIIGHASDNDVFLAKSMFLLVILMVIWVALGKVSFFTEYKWVHWIVTIAVSVLAVRWFSDIKIIRTAILPYSVLGIVIACGIPFVIYFFIVESLRSRTMRKVAWVLFAVVFVALWITRSSDVGKWGFIYLITAGASIVVLSLDGTIQKMFKRMSIERGLRVQDVRKVHSLRDQLDRISDRYEKDGDGYIGLYGVDGHAGYEGDRKKIQKQINKFIKE
jgi:hypothetical protein